MGNTWTFSLWFAVLGVIGALMFAAVEPPVVAAFFDTIKSSWPLIAAVDNALPLILVSLVFYFVPLLVADYRNHRQTLAIGVLNVFAGWTLVGWIAALVWACTNPAPATQAR